MENNPFDCGITLASHPLFNANPPAAEGVYHNTIVGDTSRRNGLQLPGAGAGIGIFAPAPFTKAYANVVVNNIATDSIVIAHLNDLADNTKSIVNLDGGTVDGTLNWWGCQGGPTASGCSGVSGTVPYLPFLTQSFAGNSEHD